MGWVIWGLGLLGCGPQVYRFEKVISSLSCFRKKGRPRKINAGGKGRKQIKVNIEKVPLAMYG